MGKSTPVWEEIEVSHLQISTTRALDREAIIVIWVLLRKLLQEIRFLYGWSLYICFKQFSAECEILCEEIGSPSVSTVGINRWRAGSSCKATSCQCKQRIHQTAKGSCFNRKSTAFKEEKQKKFNLPRWGKFDTILGNDYFCSLNSTKGVIP